MSGSLDDSRCAEIVDLLNKGTHFDELLDGEIDMTEAPKRIWAKNTIIFQARLWRDKEPVAPRHDPDKYCAYIRADIADEMLHFIRQLFNGLETDMIKFETPADEAMALLLRKGSNAIAKAEAAKCTASKTSLRTNPFKPENLE